MQRDQVTRKYPTAWKLHCEFLKDQTPRQAPVMPEELLYGIVTTLFLIGQVPVAIALLTTFCGCLRISEALALRVRDVHFVLVAGCWQAVLVLGKTKRGTEEKVVPTNSVVVQILALYMKWRGGRREAKVFGMSYTTAARWLSRACAALGFSHVGFRTHSLRRGAASTLLASGHPIPNIMLCGRWQAEKNLREHFRKGDVALLQLRTSKAAGSWEMVHKYSALLPSLIEMLPKQ